MIRLKRSEALWIVRGIRLAKFLRCCGRTARRIFHSAPSEAEAETVDAVEVIEPRLPAARVRAVEAKPSDRDPPRRRFESAPACADKRPGSDLAAARLAKGAGAGVPSRPRH